MKVAIISLGSVSSKWTAKAMRKYFDEVDELDLKQIEVNMGAEHPEVLYKGKLIDKYDCIYAKGSFRYNPLLASITTVLKKECYMPIEAIAFTLAHDKLLTQLKLNQAGIPMPKTYISATTQAAKGILKKINYPIILKFPEGTQGKGVMFADSFATSNSILDALTALKQPFLIQEYIETGGVDMRLFIIGDKIVGSVKRMAVKGETRANYHAGGKGKIFTPTPKITKIAINAAKAIGTEVCAVDLLEGVKGPLVIELNISPGLQGITSITGIDIADKIASFLYKKTKDISSTEKENGAKEILKNINIKDELQKEIITNLELRGSKIILPDIISKISGLKEDDEITIKVENGKIIVEKVKM